MVSSRPPWDEYFIQIMHAVATRATCDRAKSAAVIVRDKRILTTGYVGAPAGMAHCDDVGHLLKDSIKPNGERTQNCIRGIHAEINAVVQAALLGVSLKDATIYCKMEPCPECAKAIIAAGIKRIVAEFRYKDGELTRKFLNSAGVELVVLNDEIAKY
ncbi:MAG: cytidine/deoxycytidylate deaminase family protein [DPANN group archaeon]|nr:cytidine/deoxycytidylate deaminase family protein [DPANN group archaeon]